MSAPKPVVLCILDGWGLREEEEANAPKLARTPTMDHLMATCPNATLGHARTRMWDFRRDRWGIRKSDT